MNTYFACLSIAAVAIALPLRAEESRIEFRNPSEQNTLRINAGRNNVKIRGVSGNEIKAISTRPDAPPEPARPDGLRVLGAKNKAMSLSLESGNLAVLDAGIRPAIDTPPGQGDLEVTVPRKTTVIVKSVFEGDVTISDLDGDVEVTALNGDVVLEKLKGAAVVETTRGDVKAGFAEVSGRKPLSFSSNNGAIVVRIPKDSKADVRLRTQSGEMLTDFSDSEFKIRQETLVPSRTATLQSSRSATASSSASASRSSSSSNSNSDSDSSIEAVVAREVEKAAREIEKQARDIEKMKVEIYDQEIKRREELRAKPPLSVVVKPPTISGFSTFSFSGGHSISGDLNGGGTEISITTLRGDITLRKL